MDKKRGIVLVGKRNGKRVVKWTNLIVLSYVLSMTVGLGSGAVYYFLAGQWRHFPVLYGIGVGLGVIGFGLISGLKTPIANLRSLD